MENIKQFDIVYVLGKGSSNNNAELRYSLRSVEKFVKGVKNVFVVGSDPGFLSDKVIYIPTTDLYPGDHENKDRNHWHNIETVCKDKRLSENFLFASDDNIVMKPSVWSDFAPRQTGIADEAYLNSINSPLCNGWRKTRIKTLLRFKGKTTYLWHPHMFSQINKTKFLECCKDSDYRNRNDVVIFTYYYNHDPMPKPLKDFDTEEFHYAKKLATKARHISHWDEAFNYPPFRKTLNDMFPKKSKYEAFDMQDDGYDLSLIIPCYNSEKYIDECLNSIINNSSKHKIQIICINDGSTDNTLAKLNNYADKFDNVEIVDIKKNQGQSHAKNIGLQKAFGRYIYFVDSDDKLAKNGIDKIIEMMDKNQLQILSVNAQAFFDNDEIAKKYKRYLKYYHRVKLPSVMNGKDALNFFFSHNDNNNASCMFIFRRELLININANFKEGIFYEDAPFNMYAMLNANRVANITDIIYERRVRSGSTVTQIKSFKHFRSYIIASLLSFRNILKKCLPIDKQLIFHLMKWQVIPHFKSAISTYENFKKSKKAFNDMIQFNDNKKICQIFYKLNRSKLNYNDFLNAFQILSKM